MTNEVVIITTVADVATDDVIGHLRHLDVDIVRINTEDFPFESTFSLDFEAPTAEVWVGGRRLQPRSVWYRRVRSPACPPTMDPGIYEFCLRENRAAFLGGWLAQDVRWLNHPVAVWQAEYKPYQLQVAKRAGLTVPQTLISSDPAQIRNAFERFGSLVVKPARSGHFRQGGEEFSVYTSEVTASTLDSIDDARWAPSIYQERVPKQCDVRVTYVGGQFFTAAIDSQSDPDAAVDWRKTSNAELRHCRLRLEGNVEDRLRTLMKALKLNFGCIDLVLRPDGQYVFLEVNPSGQWLWLDDQLELGISAAVADWLAAP
jgi:glutathione synthase/RimK-type ligase-like ATP-grasp enzyme